MKILTLNNDCNIPMLGLGTWKSKPGEVYQAIRWAFKIGYRHIDCAAAYGNQEEIGQAILDAINEKDIKREEIFVTSKLWNDSHGFYLAIHTGRHHQVIRGLSWAWIRSGCAPTPGTQLQRAAPL